MPDDPRQLLAGHQQALLDALTRGGGAPAGFDPTEVETAAASLANKRMRSAQKAWPALAEALGDRFEALFREYARRQPLIDESPHQDARRFLGFILAGKALATQERVKLLSVRAQSGFPLRLLVTRRGFAFAFRAGGRIRTGSIGNITARRTSSPAD